MLISAGDVSTTVNTWRDNVTHFFTISGGSLTEAIVDVSMNIPIVQFDALH